MMDDLFYLRYLSQNERDEFKDLMTIANNLTDGLSSWMRLEWSHPDGFPETWFIDRLKFLKEKNERGLQQLINNTDVAVNLDGFFHDNLMD